MTARQDVQAPDAWTLLDQVRMHRAAGDTAAADTALTRAMHHAWMAGDARGKVWCWFESALLPICDDPVGRLLESVSLFQGLGDTVGVDRARRALLEEAETT